MGIFRQVLPPYIVLLSGLKSLDLLFGYLCAQTNPEHLLQEGKVVLKHSLKFYLKAYNKSEAELCSLCRETLRQEVFNECLHVNKDLRIFNKSPHTSIGCTTVSIEYCLQQLEADTKY